MGAEQDHSGWIGQTVGEVLAESGITYDDAELVDEPPGKLRQIVFTVSKGGERCRAELTLVYVRSLFSAEREWSRDAVSAATVRSVEIVRESR